MHSQGKPPSRGTEALEVVSASYEAQARQDAARCADTGFVELVVRATDPPLVAQTPDNPQETKGNSVSAAARKDQASTADRPRTRGPLKIVVSPFEPGPSTRQPDARHSRTSHRSAVTAHISATPPGRSEPINPRCALHAARTKRNHDGTTAQKKNVGSRVFAGDPAYQGAQIGSGDLTDPNGTRCQAAPRLTRRQQTEPNRPQSPVIVGNPTIFRH
jgi:hypothetical protein